MTKEELEGLYIKEGKSAKHIAEQYGVSSQTVALRAGQYGLSKRGPRKAAGGGGKKRAAKKKASKGKASAKKGKSKKKAKSRKKASKKTEKKSA